MKRRREQLKDPAYVVLLSDRIRTLEARVEQLEGAIQETARRRDETERTCDSRAEVLREILGHAAARLR